MLESCVNQELCRNGKSNTPTSPIQQLFNSPEQGKVEPIQLWDQCPLFHLGAEGILVSSSTLVASIEQDNNVETLKVREIATFDFDAELRQKAAEFVGFCTVKNTGVAVESVPDGQTTTLYGAIELARNGDPEAQQRVRSNVVTDRFERRNKYGFTMKVQLGQEEDGTLTQFGQTLHQNTQNSIAYISNRTLLDRAKGPEARNAFRLQECKDKGLLKDNYLVTASLIADGMTDEKAEEAGFFHHTWSLSLQVASEEDSKTEISSIFLASREAEAHEPFDKEAIIRFARMLGIDYEGAGTEEILDRPFLVPKELLKHGSASISFLYDLAAFNVTGQYKFYGRDTDKEPTIQDYLNKEATDKRSIEMADEQVNKTVQKLINSDISNPVEATEMLAKLNEKELKEVIVKDKTIDARVLSSSVAWQVNHARYLMDHDPTNTAQLNLLQNYISENGKSSSCPGGASNNTVKDIGKINTIDGLEIEESEDLEIEDCEFTSKECPKCGDKNVKTIRSKGVYYGECGCSSSSSGKRVPTDVRVALGT